MSEDEQGVVFPAGPDGRRSTAALGRAVIADALRPVDAAGALAAERETNWRAGYLTHFRRTVEAGLPSGAAARSIAGAKLLQQFVGDVPWAHLDIAGTAWADGEAPHRDAGGTGSMVRAIVELAGRYNAG